LNHGEFVNPLESVEAVSEPKINPCGNFAKASSYKCTHSILERPAQLQNQIPLLLLLDPYPQLLDVLGLLYEIFLVTI
jgi:hypothetical protein